MNVRLIADGLRQENQTVETPLLHFLRWSGVVRRNCPQVHNIVGKSVGLAKSLHEFAVVISAIGSDRVGGSVHFRELVARDYGDHLVAAFSEVCG